MAIISVGYDGTVDEVQWAGLAPQLGAAESVEDGFSAAALTTPDRAVSIGAGTATAHGVRVVSDSAVTLTCDSVASGTRYDTIALRRDWTGEQGVTSLVVVKGNATRAVASGVQKSPGVRDDQPLWLARVQAGSSTIAELVDLRAYASKVISVPSLAALPSAPVGTIAISAGRLVQRRRDSAGVVAWHGVAEGEWLSYVPTWTASGANPTLGTGTTRLGWFCRIGQTVHFTLTMVTGSGFRPGDGFYSVGLPVAPATNVGTQVVTADVLVAGQGDWVGAGKIESSRPELTRIYLAAGSNTGRSRAIGSGWPTWQTGSKVHASGSYVAAGLTPT